MRSRTRKIKVKVIVARGKRENYRERKIKGKVKKAERIG